LQALDLWPAVAFKIHRRPFIPQPLNFSKSRNCFGEFVRTVAFLHHQIRSAECENQGCDYRYDDHASQVGKVTLGSFFVRTYSSRRGLG
jgi:hypothetical protein